MNQTELPDWYPDAYLIFNFLLSYLQIIGLFINLFHFLILFQKLLRSISIYRLMMGICFCDILTHITTFLIFSPFLIRSPPPDEEECFNTLSYFDAFLQKYGVILLDSTQRASTWLALFMALFRTLSISFPMSGKVKKLSNPVVSLHTILLVSLISLGWGWEVMSRKIITPRFEDQDCNENIVTFNTSRYSVSVPSDLLESHYQIVSIYGAIKALPSLLDLVLTVILVIGLKKAASVRRRIGQADGHENTTKLVFFMTVLNFMVEAPNGFSHVALAVFHEDRQIASTTYMITVFAEILPVINSSSHLFVCLLMSSQYRSTARKVFGGGNIPNVVSVT